MNPWEEDLQVVEPSQQANPWEEDYQVAEEQPILETPTKKERSAWDIADSIAAGVYNAADTALFGLGSGAVRLIGGKEAADKVKKFVGQHPIASDVGTIAGFFTPGGAPMKALKYGGKAAKKIAGSSKFWNKAKEMGAIAVATEGEFELQKEIQRLAGTREDLKGRTALGEFGEGVVWNMALQSLFGTAGWAINKARNFVSTNAKSISLMGGKENILKAQEARNAALASGANDKDAADIFMASVAEGMGDQEVAILDNMIKKNSTFAKFVRNQMAGSDQVVEDSIKMFTKPEYGKYSHDVLKNVWGPEYKNTFGSTEIDFSENGLKQLLGTNNEQAVLQERGKALARAEERVMMDPNLSTEVRNNFKDLSDDLMRKGSKDYERALMQVEPASINSFAGSVEEAGAKIELANIIHEMQQANQEVTPARISGMKREIMRSAARKHLDNIMAEGTSSVNDINDIKEFFKFVDESAVESGKSEALGAFNEGVNKTILVKLDPILYEANQALIYEKSLINMHAFGDKFDGTKLRELDGLIYNGTSAEEAAAKLSAFKMGYLNKLENLAINGDRIGFEKAVNLAKSPKGLGQYFSVNELGDYINIIKPKMEASLNLKKMLQASDRFVGEAELAPEAVRTAIGVAGGARVGAANAAIGWVTKAKYGKGTADRIMQYAQNPSAMTFNNMVNKTTDLLEKKLLQDDIALWMASEQAAIRAMRGGAIQGE